MLESGRSWDASSAGCPGMGKGLLHSREEIDAILARQRAEPVITREISR
jgi:hypothetical protein